MSFAQIVGLNLTRVHGYSVGGVLVAVAVAIPATTPIVVRRAYIVAKVIGLRGSGIHRYPVGGVLVAVAVVVPTATPIVVRRPDVVAKIVSDGRSTIHRLSVGGPLIAIAIIIAPSAPIIVTSTVIGRRWGWVIPRRRFPGSSMIAKMASVIAVVTVVRIIVGACLNVGISSIGKLSESCATNQMDTCKYHQNKK